MALGFVLGSIETADAATMGERLASLDTLGLVLHASLAVQLVLLLLAVLSVASWAIIAFKWRELRRARQDSEAFIEVYQQGSMDAAYEAARDLDRSPLAQIFLSGYSELSRISRLGGSRRGSRGAPSG